MSNQSGTAKVSGVADVCSMQQTLVPFNLAFRLGLKLIHFKYLAKVMLNRKTLSSQSFDFFLSLGCKHPPETPLYFLGLCTAYSHLACVRVRARVHACLRKNNDF